MEKSSSTQEEVKLSRTLTPLMLWGLGVGYVISGMYFGWNLGLEKGGTMGLGIATLFIIILYVTFTFSYAELASAIPQAGGGFDYTRRAFGDTWGFMAGMAQNIEFIFAPPAIAFAIGAYFNLFFPSIPILAIAIVSYIIFTALNIRGVKISALFELSITLFAVGELLLFAGITLPHFSAEAFFENSLPNGIPGIFAALPFAIWFFLGLEGVANVAEETINPQRTIKVGFSSALITLVLLCLLVFAGAVGVGGWENIVYKEDGSTSDSPLPLALISIVGNNNILYHLLITIGLFGLVASFHGLILAAGRASYEFGKVRFAPPVFGKIHPRFHTPANALLLNMGMGIFALLTGKTAEIITIAVFGALFLYLFSMLALVKLRKTEPDLPRPFKVPFYPLFPFTALVITVVALLAMIVFNFYLFLIFFIIMSISVLLFLRFKKSIS
jgi:ethanolamine permease